MQVGTKSYHVKCRIAIPLLIDGATLPRQSCGSAGVLVLGRDTCNVRKISNTTGMPYRATWRRLLAVAATTARGVRGLGRRSAPRQLGSKPATRVHGPGERGCVQLRQTDLSDRIGSRQPARLQRGCGFVSRE